MSSNSAIVLEKVCKRYESISSTLFRRFVGNNGDLETVVWALNNVSFNVKFGEVIGIIGPNGAGKSTILKLLAGVTSPDEGEVMVNGRVAPLIELGAGFHPELSGRENVFLNGALMGLSRDEMNGRYESIVEFSEMTEYMNMPVKKYSSGMFVRLAFALAIHTNPDILLVDEVLSVGDERFQRKCLAWFSDFRSDDKAVVIVSHDLPLISSLCDRVLFLNGGELIENGTSEAAVSQYLQSILNDADSVASIKTDELTLLFSGGKGCLYWKGREVTKRLGLYTSMLFRKSEDMPLLWLDSTRADWKVQKTSEREVVCIGRFIALPVMQKWTISLNDDNELSWAVELYSEVDFVLERQTESIMLSSEYNCWSVGGEINDFPKDFTSRDYYNWDILESFAEGSVDVLGNESLPKISITNLQQGKHMDILNSSLYFSGRVITSVEHQLFLKKDAEYKSETIIQLGQERLGGDI